MCQAALTELIIGAPRRPAHDVLIGRVEAEGRRWRSVGDEVDPQELHRDQACAAGEKGEGVREGERR